MSTMNPQQELPSLIVSFRNSFIPSSSLMVHQNNEKHNESTTSHTRDTKGKIHFILASQSPRRREILDMMGLNNLYTVQVSPLDESALAAKLLIDGTTLNPKEYTGILAKEKALALASQLLQQLVEKETSKKRLQQENQPMLVLGSDTIVVLDDKILEKPIDHDDAKRMLRTLSNRSHVVHTGVALVCVVPSSIIIKTTTNEWKIELIESFTETAIVQFTNLSTTDIDSYVATNEPMDKAGSYGIQGIGGQMIERIEGDFFTVMGLPMHRTSKALVKAITYINSYPESTVDF